MIRRMVTDHDDANDVLQNVWIKVFRNIDNFILVDGGPAIAVLMGVPLSVNTRPRNDAL